MEQHDTFAGAGCDSTSPGMSSPAQTLSELKRAESFCSVYSCTTAFHFSKAQERMANLQDILKTQNLTQVEKEIANALLQDLKEAVKIAQ